MYLPYLNFLDPLPETHLFLFGLMCIVYSCNVFVDSFGIKIDNTFLMQSCCWFLITKRTQPIMNLTHFSLASFLWDTGK